jgi:alpha-tubulin suppressor-like RCC1 family protein
MHLWRFTLSICIVVVTVLTLNPPPVLQVSAKAGPALSAQVTQPQVIGGAPADLTAIGGYVYVNSANGRCNGALIHPEWVVTAAYCIVAYNAASQPLGRLQSAAQITVELGCYTKPTGGVCFTNSTLQSVYNTTPQRLKVSEIAQHPAMVFVNNQPNPAYDVVLLKLEKPVRLNVGITPMPLALASDNMNAEQQPQIVSFGDYMRIIATATPGLRTPTATLPLTPMPTSEFTEGATTLRTAPIQIISDGACTLPGFVGATLWCAHPPLVGTDICKGDTGAPLVSTVNGQMVLFGLSLPKTQFGLNACADNTQAALIDVTSAPIRDWIVSTITTKSPKSLQRSYGGVAGFGSLVLPQGDDVLQKIDVSDIFTQGIKIGTTTSSVLSVANDGVVALGDITSLPQNLPNLRAWMGVPLIAAFAADVDTRNASLRAVTGARSTGSNRVWIAKDVGNRQITITWDDVRPYPQTSRLFLSNAFQLQIRAQSASVTTVTFTYDAIQWTYGENSCGRPCRYTTAQHAQIGIATGASGGTWVDPSSGNADKLRALAQSKTVYIANGKISETIPVIRPTATGVIAPTATTVPTAKPINTSDGISTEDLLAWYPLNGIRTTGSTIPIQAVSVMGPVQYFDGVDDYHQTTVDLANKSFTVAFWAAFDWKDQYQLVIGGGSAATTNQGFMIGGIQDLSLNNDAYIYCGFYGNDLHYKLPPVFDKHAWHHYACSYNISSGLRQIWIDGVVVTSDISASPLITTNEFWIARSPWNNAYFRGMLRDVIVYDQPLAADEINRIKEITPNSVMLSEPHPASACRWVDRAGMVHEYEINHDLLTWDQAKSAAEARIRGGQKGYLATITSAAENECLGQLVDTQRGWISGTTGFGPWLGAKRVSPGGAFIWQGGPEKGVQIKSAVAGSAIGYDNWYAGEPNDVDGIENSLLIWHPGNTAWNDIASTAALKSIIEYTYNPANTITGLTFVDANKNQRVDPREALSANVPVTLTMSIAQPIDLVGGGNQFCARLDDGRATCWGRRGDAWRWDQQSAVPIEVDGWRDVRAISNGINTSCALLGNGTVSCLGKNTKGAVGDGTTADRWTPVTVSGLSNVVALNSGAGYHHCAILADTTVRCWGDNYYAQLGNNSYNNSTTPVVVVGLSGITQISVGERHTCARKSAGTVWCWGSNEVGQLATVVPESKIPVQVTGLTGVTMLASGPQHVCVRRGDTQVACWGHPAGITGERSGAYVTTPTVIANTSGSVSLSVGNEQSCVAKSDGTVWCWGHVFHGEAGWVASGTTTTRRSSAAQMTSVNNIVQVALSANSGCGRRANGDMLCWGEANMGQLGDGTYQPRGIARDVRVTWQTNPYAARVAMLDASYLYQCGILTDRRVACWGLEGFYRPANHYIKPEPEIVEGLHDIVDLHVSTTFACALQRTGLVWCWGYDLPTWIMESGTLGGSTVERVAPRRLITITNAIALAKGNGSYCLAVTADGNAYCYADTGPLQWTTTYKMIPSSTVTNVGNLGPSYIHNCALKQDGTVWCWGDNSYFAQYGNGVANTTNNVPVQVAGLSTIQQLAVSSYHNCVVLSTGSVQCWGQAQSIGSDGSGQLSASRGSAYATPKTIDGISNAKKIVANPSKNCAILQNGTVWCWGHLLYDGERTASITPYQISGITDAVDISISASVCVLRRTGDVLCWGNGGAGGLGNGQTTSRTIPRAISEPWQANVNQGCEWVDWQGQRHSYESLHGGWTWVQARDMAATRTWRGASGYLATITSPEENRCVHQLFMKKTLQGGQWPAMRNGWYPRQWLGGSDAESEGTWKWMTGPEAGTTFRIPSGENPGFNSFQTLSQACRPACDYIPENDYLQIMYPYGTSIQQRQWNNERNIDAPVGAIVEYNSAGGEPARTLRTTSDALGRYRFDNLSPGVYRVAIQTSKGTVERQIVILDTNRSVIADMNTADIIQPVAGTQTLTPIPTSTPTKYAIPTWTASRTPTASRTHTVTRTFTPSLTRSLTRTLSPTASNTPLPRPILSMYGDGHDGTLDIGTGQARAMPDYAQIRTAAGAVSAGATTISLNAACSGFVSNNDEVLIHQTQGGLPGTYEFALVKTCSGTTLTLWDATTNAYTVSSGVVQILKVHNFVNVNAPAASLVAAPWNGSIGGILVFKALGTVTAQVLNVDASGFRGGGRGAYGAPNADGEQGETVIQGRSRTSSRNALAGGGGRGDNGAGGGGSAGGGASHLVRGAAGAKGKGSAGGEAGGSFNDLSGTLGNLSNYRTRILLASGGGGGGANDGAAHYGGYGGTGAGAIIVQARSIVLNRISANASSGTNAANVSGSGEGGGGGGAGGSIFVRGSSVVVTELALWGGNGGNGYYASGGYGADGAAQVEYCQTVQISTVTGRTTGSIVPTYNAALCQ